MKNAILLHGMPDKDEFYGNKMPSPSNAHWFPWLQKELSVLDYNVQTPEVPKAYAPDYATWEKTFEIYPLNEESVLIGHSCGGGFLLRYLSEQKTPIKKLILVAPWLDPKRTDTTDFFDFVCDKELGKRIKEIHLFYSTDDWGDILTSVTQIKSWLPEATIHEFSDKGHFCEKDLHSKEFPELLETII